MGRQTSMRYVKNPPRNFYFPSDTEDPSAENYVGLTVAEFEAMRLKHYISLNQKDSADNMSVSQPTFSRILDKAHQKITQALIEEKIYAYMVEILTLKRVSRVMGVYIAMKSGQTN